MGLKTKPKKYEGAITDPYFKDCVLVPVSSKEKDWVAINAIDKGNVAKDTYYRVRVATGVVMCLVNVIPDGNHIAWDTCSSCLSYFTRCRCQSGIKNPRYIVDFYNRADHEVNDVPRITTKQLYEAVPDNRVREVREPKPTVRVTTITPAEFVEGVNPFKPTKKQKKVKTNIDKSFEEEGLDVSKINSGTIDKSAKGIADSSTDDLMNDLLADTKSKKQKKSHGK